MTWCHPGLESTADINAWRMDILSEKGNIDSIPKINIGTKTVVIIAPILNSTIVIGDKRLYPQMKVFPCAERHIFPGRRRCLRCWEVDAWLIYIHIHVYIYIYLYIYIIVGC